MPDDRTDVSTEPAPTDPEAVAPASYLVVHLADPERSTFESWLDRHLEQITEEMAEVLARFEQDRNQLEGIMPGADYPYPGAFRVNVPVTKKKIREIANRVKQAYLDSDPIWAVTSPPGQPEQHLLAQEVERGLDHQMDQELDSIDDLSQALFESVLHGTGFLEACWDYQEDVVRDLATYTPFDGVTLDSLNDLFRFEADYPNWTEEPELRRLHTRLATGRPVEVLISYSTPVRNHPKLRFIPSTDVRVYPSVAGAEGLRITPLYGYVRTYTRAELEELARANQIDADALTRVFDDAQREKTTGAEEQQDTYEVFLGTARYQLQGDQEPARYKVWFETESGVLLRTRRWWWWSADPDLIPLYTRQEDPGFFKRGFAWDLVDTHTCQNVMMNLLLNAIDRANSMQFKAKSGSMAEQHLLARRWSPHLPMPYETDPAEVEPMLSNTAHITAIVQGLQLLKLQADEETQTSSLQSGRESPTDPSAPATKTIALLRQVEPNTKETLRSLEPGFRVLGRWVLLMYYQAKRLGWISAIPGFPEIPDEQLPELARQLAPRAVLFEYDRSQRVQTNVTVMGLLAQYAPQAVPVALKTVIGQMDSQWARLVNQLPLTPPMMPGLPGQPGPAGGGQPGGGAPASNGNRMPGDNPMAALLSGGAG